MKEAVGSNLCQFLQNNKWNALKDGEYSEMTSKNVFMGITRLRILVI